ncbi:MAG: cobyrinate a,c-diamide synthase, partial [Pyramidobacter sp.]|nr:cobyrinate a,c-diamide synthase [Pyramidobacter sp.]
MNNSLNVPRLVIAAPQSGSGKTTLTCGILAALARRGVKVQAYKVGPDYIDPGYLGLASGRAAHNLDTWLMDEAAMLRVFAHSAAQADAAV